MRIFNITDFGAIGDGRTLNTKPLQLAAEACQRAGGGIVRVPSGTFLTGTFELFDRTTLLVEKEGRLLASPRIEDHVVGNASVGLFYARDARDIVLTGEGVLDGNAPVFFDESVLHNGGEDFSGAETWQKQHGVPYGTMALVHGPLATRGRPGNMIVLARCREVRIEKLALVGSPYWTLHCADCDDVSIENLRIDNDLRHPNNDGIHLTSCSRVSIRHCRISCADDAVAVTGFREHGGETQIAFGLSGMVRACEDIEISDCILTSRSAAVRIGYGQNPVRRVHLSRLDIRESNRGIGIFARQADVEDVRVENCRIQTTLFHGNYWGRGEPVHVSALRFPGEARLFHVRRIQFHDIEATGENASVFFAEEPGAIDHVEMIRVRSILRRGGLFNSWGGNLDLRPAANPQLSIVAGGTAPLWCVGVSNLRREACKWKLDGPGVSVFSPDPVIRDSLWPV